MDENTDAAPRQELYTALAKAQGQIPPILKDRTVVVQKRAGGTYQFSYAQLETILAAVKKPLSDNALSLIQRIVTQGDKEYIETLLAHTSGQTVSNLVRMMVIETGPQAYGSAQMYARRQGVTLLLCLAAEDDDDANRAEGNQVEPEDNPIGVKPRPRTSPMMPDHEVIDGYAERIISLIDQADPAGALVLYEELDELERGMLWKHPKMTIEYKGKLRQASKASQAAMDNKL